MKPPIIYKPRPPSFSSPLSTAQLTEHGKGRFIVIELLSRKQAEARPGPAGSFRVWALHLTNPTDPDGTAVMALPPTKDGGVRAAYPPVQVTVSGGSAPSLAHLKRPLGDALGIEQIDHMRVFRYCASANPPKVCRV